MQVASGIRLEFCGGGVQFWWWYSVALVIVDWFKTKKRKWMADKPLSVTACGSYVGDGNDSDEGGPYSGYGDDDGGW
ncbi:hypothetical protein QVD17_00306 [Tagetes erecta]|uniref:Uncharacterized protein n=1 Tax=Tagetes erecta TaxID=13708 RepID=A0AAD8L5J4_TARER|nr:hypothetical protein QVD17_00306 [Tagetes erecta]